MPIANAANINDTGVLLSSSGLTQLRLSDDQSTIKVGAGNTWGDVYQYLAMYELTVVGGRSGKYNVTLSFLIVRTDNWSLGSVGVSGFLLGGGISFLGNQYGWASANVIQFDVRMQASFILSFADCLVMNQCVLANGTIISATADEYFDLFWALRGGGNSFAIVTAFHLKTYSLPVVTVGETAYGPNVSTQFLDYVYDFAVNGSGDAKAAIEPRAQFIQGTGAPSYFNIMFYDGDNTAPTALVNFTEVLSPINSTFEVRPSMYNYTQGADAERSALDGLRACFNVVSIKADRKALQIVHDIFLEAAQSELASVTDLVASIAFIPITKDYLTASTVNGGDPMEVDPSEAPYLWIEETLLWSNTANDTSIVNFLAAFNTNVSNQLDSLGDVTSSFLYLNYAGENQLVFEGYPVDNVHRMQSIRDNYDPEMVFTKLMPGGWKVTKAFTGQEEA